MAFNGLLRSAFYCIALNQKVDPTYKFVLPDFVNNPIWKDDKSNATKGLGNGNVVHLTDEHFWNFRQHRHFMWVGDGGCRAA